MSPAADTLKSPKSRKKSDENASSRQQSLLEMFTRKPKRKVSDNSVSELISNEAKPDEKRARINIDDNPVLSDKENVEPENDKKSSKEQKIESNVSAPKAPVQKIKCKECRQFLNEVSVYPGDPAGAEEEFVVLTHESLSLFVGNEETGRPQHKVTGFTVYDKGMHICSFDSGLIEKNIELYFSGVIKPVFEEDPGLEGGVPGKRLGPINEWFTAGFDGGEKALVGFSTGFADYFLMEPSSQYLEHWVALQEKIYMSKNVIEFLSDNPIAVYEDLVNRIQTTVPPASLGVQKFTEDSLLRHAQFVVEQVESYDSARSEDEDSLLGTPCVRDLIHLAGVTLGKRRMARRNPVLKKEKHVKASSTRATTTRLVAEIMEQFFQGTMDATTGNKIRRRRCGVCEACLKPECGKCASCRDMVKFGGSGRSKQTCVDRKCPNMGLDDGEEEQDIEEEEAKMKPSPVKSSRVKQQIKRSFKWIGDPIFEVEKDSDCCYYASIKIGDEIYKLGDCVSVLSDTEGENPYVGRIMYMWQADSKMVHIDWFVRSSETILQETGDPAEVFLVDECENMKVACIDRKVEVHFKPVHKDWFFMGGVADDRQLPKCDGKTSFYFQKWYDPDIARFVDPPSVEITDEPDFCPSCARLGVIEKRKTPTVTVELRQSDNKVFYKVASKDGVDYTIGDSIYLPVEAFSFDSKPPKQKKPQQPKPLDEIDEDEYPEYYRKGGYVKGSNELVSKPFRIARIIQIYCNKTAKKNRDIKLKVTKFYRPENTPIKNPYYFDLNLLYWSDEEATVDFASVEGRCRVECKYDLNVSTNEYSKKGKDRFYFAEWFNANMQEFTEPPSKSRKTALKKMIENESVEGAKKFTKITKVAKVTKVEEEDTESEDEVEVKFSKLHTLDVFSGCGGLSEGFHQAGVAEPAFAVELWEPAAQAYRLNNPGTTVFTEDCNVLLDLVMSGHEKSSCGQRLPQKGDVELLCGGPPCQGFSGMNRFNSREYSRFKNSLVVSYLSYCDYYRPRFFLLENVRNFVSYKNCMVLKLALASLIKMGYQCTFGVLQAGHYGVAQTRRRAIILAAAPGEKLPLYPEPLHTFSTRGGSLTAQVGDKRYTNNIKRLDAAPFRTITVRDALFDLPRIPNGHSKLEISYNGEAQSHFQRNIRGYQDILRDHVCKDMSALVAARMKMIPLLPGSDWRDLPNKVVKLSDGSMTKLLSYEHHDKKQGKGPTGALRGVCSCATGKACDPLDRQFNTLIPWCLPHTGNRHNNWAGLYGRLAWDGFFSTTVTNPEPMGKQGRVLHPVQDRVVSVRECARSQGFPDTYRFFGTTLDKHREVGNAVPPPMAKAIGLEIKKCLQWKAHASLKKEAGGL